MPYQRKALYLLTCMAVCLMDCATIEAQSFSRNGEQFLLVKAKDLSAAAGWKLETPSAPHEEPQISGTGNSPLTVEIELPAGTYYLYVRGRMVTAYSFDKNESAKTAAAGAGYRISIDNDKNANVFGAEPILYEKVKGRLRRPPGNGGYSYKWQKGHSPIEVKKSGKHSLRIVRADPNSRTPIKIAAILLTTRTNFRLPEPHVTAKRLGRSLNMKNSLALYAFPRELLVKETPRAIPYRSGDNITLVTFHGEGYGIGPAKPWELYSFKEFPEMFMDDPELKKKALEGVSRNLAALREKTLKIKKTSRYAIANVNLIHVPFWAQEKLLRLHPDADPKYYRKRFYKRPTHLCALSKEAEKLTIGMISELFANVPLDGLMLTMGDNTGYWQCVNPQHQHHKDWLKRVPDPRQRRKMRYDPIYSEQAFLNIVKWVYEGMKKHRKRPILLLRSWGGPGRVFKDDERRKNFLTRINIPAEDFFLTCKHSTPPSMDYCWKPASYAPIMAKAVNKFAILGWGEDAGTKSMIPVTIWYDWPDIIQRDVKHLAALGVKGTMGIDCSSSVPEQELSHLAVGCVLRDPDLDLAALKLRWAEFRFGKKAGAHVLAAIEYGPKIMEKHTLWHEGRGQMASIHFLSTTGRTHYRVRRAVPPWMKTVNGQNYRKLQERLNATDQAEAMLREIKAAQKLRPDDEMIELYVQKAQATVHLARWFRDYHHAYLHRMMYLNLKKKNRPAALKHIRQGMKLYESALKEVEKYAKVSPPYGILGFYYMIMHRETSRWFDKMRDLVVAEGLSAEYSIGKTYYVTPTGSDKNDGTSPQLAWASLQGHSLDKGDVIRVQGGTYRLTGDVFLPTDGITYSAEAGKVTLKGPATLYIAKSKNFNTGRSNVASVTIEGFKLVNVTVAHRGSNFKFRNNFVDSTGQSALYLRGAQDFLIESNRILCRSGKGKTAFIINGHCSGTIRNNTVWGYRRPLYLRQCNVEIKHNIFISNAGGTLASYKAPGKLVWDTNIINGLKNNARGSGTKTFVTANARLVDPAAGDLRLRSDSPAIGAGSDKSNIGWQRSPSI